MNEWQAIETAPKDGTPIIGWDGYDMSTCYWKAYENQWRLCVPGFRAQDADFEPVMWQPCPESPK
jgi:hypothetical protein